MTDAWRRYLAAAQIAGGAAGFIGLRLWEAFGVGSLPEPAVVLAALYFALSVAAGLLLRQRHPAGLPLSLAVQAAQLIVVVVPEANLLFLSGPYLRVLLPGSGFGLGVGGGGLCDATLVTGVAADHVGMALDVGFRQHLVRGEEFRAYGVNVLALVAAWKVTRAWLAEPVRLEQPEAAAADTSAPVV